MCIYMFIVENVCICSRTAARIIVVPSPATWYPPAVCLGMSRILPFWAKVFVADNSMTRVSHPYLSVSVCV